jgi:asparagine synthase (glutamine-hydrolysing)
MTEVIRHRGPDADGFYENTKIGLGVRRLRIIDLVTGDQPIFNEDKSICIVLNGEIYNYQNLRQILLKKGHIFRTDTDTETIVHGYEEEGYEFVKNIRGMFAFALWDNNLQTLILARDRVGEKPLYYYIDSDRLVFGSELKAVVENRSVGRDIDYRALNEYLAFGYIPSPLSIFKDVYKLPAGNLLVARKGKIDLIPYWRPIFVETTSLPEIEVIERIKLLLDESVKLCMVSDVPIGALLSGGLDSSSVVALMARHSPIPIKTFTAGFEDMDYDERAYARKIAQMYGTDHHEFVLKPGHASEILPVLARQFDEPFYDSSAIPTYYVLKNVRENVAVCLTGDGGDEVFMGYRDFPRAAFEEKLDCIPDILRSTCLGTLSKLVTWSSRARNLLNRWSEPASQRVLDYLTTMSLSVRQHILSDNLLEIIGSNSWQNPEIKRLQETPNIDFSTRVQLAKITTYLPYDGFVKVDRMSMLNSLETRAPLVDWQLIDFVTSLPLKQRFPKRTKKYLLREAMKNMLPTGILNLPKKGFSIPLSKWLGQSINEFTRDILFDRETVQRGWFRRSAIERLVTSVRFGSGSRNRMASWLWELVMLELWARNYL